MKSETNHDAALGPRRFTDFYALHADQLLVWFVRRVFDAEVALDLTSETFAQAFTSRDRFRGGGEREAAGWLYGIARHQLSRYLRRGRAETKALSRLGLQAPQLDDADLALIERMAELEELRREMEPRLMRLSAEQRDAVQLRVVDELPYPQVAERLGISEVSARARVSRALRTLAKNFEQPPRTIEETE